MAAKSEKSPRTVTGALVAVRYDDGTSGQLARGDALPESVSKESVALLEELGYLSDDK